MVINKEEVGCTSEYNPVCVRDFSTQCRVYCPGGAVFPDSMPWFYLAKIYPMKGAIGFLNEEDYLGNGLYTSTTTTTTDPFADSSDDWRKKEFVY
jgi:hypothetical protein